MTTFQHRSGVGSPQRKPDLAVAAVPLFTRLLGGLQQLGPRLLAFHQQRSRWGAPPVFFFNESQRLPGSRLPDYPPDIQVNRTALVALMEDALSVLGGSAACRHMARALPGMKGLLDQLAPIDPMAARLQATLAVADDLVLRLFLPGSGLGVRVRISAVRDLGELLHLLQNQLTKLQIRRGFQGEGQFFRPTALLPDGQLPQDLSICDHWFWGSERLDRIPVDTDGERTLLIGPAVVRTTWETERQPIRLTPEVELLEVLSRSQYADWRRRCLGHVIPESLRQAA